MPRPQISVVAGESHGVGGLESCDLSTACLDGYWPWGWTDIIIAYCVMYSCDVIFRGGSKPVSICFYQFCWDEQVFLPDILWLFQGGFWSTDMISQQPVLGWWSGHPQHFAETCISIIVKTPCLGFMPCQITLGGLKPIGMTLGTHETSWNHGDFVRRFRGRHPNLCLINFLSQ